MKQLIDRDEVLKIIVKMHNTMEHLDSVPDADAEDWFLSLYDALGTVSEATNAIQALPTHKAEEESGWFRVDERQPKPDTFHLTIITKDEAMEHDVNFFCDEDDGAYFKRDEPLCKPIKVEQVLYWRHPPQPPEVEK